MKPLLIVNDVHLGVSRVAGTTPASATALKRYLQNAFSDLIIGNKDKDLLILGDLFDSFTVESGEVLQTYNTLMSWMLVSGNKLTLVPGNHDWSAKGDRTSSFHLLAEVLLAQFGDRVQVCKPEFTRLGNNLYAVPHCANQDLFELELARAAVAPPGFLLLHCNVMNGFADRSDHSLNLTQEWCETLTKKHFIMVAHEHQWRVLNMNKGLVVLGNQFPSSVSDCMDKSSQEGAKFAYVIEGTDKTGYEYNAMRTWWADQDGAGYSEVDWQDLPGAKAKFIRAVGHATASQAVDVISTIAKFRGRSDAFIVTNAVEVEGMENMEGIGSACLDQIQSFDVLQALLDLLNEKERTVIQGILND